MLAQTRAHVCHPRNDPKSAGASRESKYNSILRRNRALKHIVYSSQHHRTTPARSKKERKKARRKRLSSYSIASFGPPERRVQQKKDNRKERQRHGETHCSRHLKRSVAPYTQPHVSISRPAGYNVARPSTHEHTNGKKERERHAPALAQDPPHAPLPLRLLHQLGPGPRARRKRAPAPPLQVCEALVGALGLNHDLAVPPQVDRQPLLCRQDEHRRRAVLRAYLERRAVHPSNDGMEAALRPAGRGKSNRGEQKTNTKTGEPMKAHVSVLTRSCRSCRLAAISVPHGATSIWHIGFL